MIELWYTARMKNKFLLFVAAVGSAIALGAVELDGGWVLSMDPANAGKTNGWAEIGRAHV